MKKKNIITILFSLIAIFTMYSYNTYCTNVVVGTTKITNSQNGLPNVLDNGDNFGYAPVNIGDLDGDGNIDIAVGAPKDDDGGTDRGAVWILFLNPDGTVKDTAKISDTHGGFNGTLADEDNFGHAIANIGDLNNDGETDLAVGAPYDDNTVADNGAVWILFLNSDGTVNNYRKMTESTESSWNVLWRAGYKDKFGNKIAALGDLDGDGNEDIAVTHETNNEYGSLQFGVVNILFLNSDGSLKNDVPIAHGTNGFPAVVEDNDFFGSCVDTIGDLDDDGVTDIAIGAYYSNDGAPDAGAIHICFMNSDGTVKATQKISRLYGGLDADLEKYFGGSVVGLGDLDGDNIEDIAVGEKARTDPNSTPFAGAVWILLLNADGTVKDTSEYLITSDTNGFNVSLGMLDYFSGSGLCNLGDLDGDGSIDMAVGCYGDGSFGAVYILNLSFSTPMPVELLSFTGNKAGAYNQLSWKTASERNNDYFVVEKSTDSENFICAGKIQGFGSSNSIQQYAFTDFEPCTPKTYYRLKQVDFNGSFEYSQIICIENNNTRKFPGKLEVFPNPALQQEVNVLLNNFNENETIRVEVQDISGRIFISKEIITNSRGEAAVSLQNEAFLPSGLYVITGRLDERIYSRRIVIR